MGIFFSLRVAWGRHRGGVQVTTMSDNQFRTVVLKERSLQRLLSNNTVFFTDYLIHNVGISEQQLCDKLENTAPESPQILHFGFVWHGPLACCVF